jgi:hypothetical protein
VADLGLAGQDVQRNHHCPQQAIGQAFGGAGNNGPVSTVMASSFLNAAGTMGG